MDTLRLSLTLEAAWYTFLTLLSVIIFTSNLREPLNGVCFPAAEHRRLCRCAAFSAAQAAISTAACGIQ